MTSNVTCGNISCILVLWWCGARRAVQPERYVRGELLIRQGDMPHAMYVLVSGSVGSFTQRNQSQAGVPGEASREAQAAAAATLSAGGSVFGGGHPAVRAADGMAPAAGEGAREQQLGSGGSTGSLGGEGGGRVGGAGSSQHHHTRSAPQRLTPTVSANGAEPVTGGDEGGDAAAPVVSPRHSPRLYASTPHGGSLRVSALRSSASGRWVPGGGNQILPGGPRVSANGGLRMSGSGRMSSSGRGPLGAAAAAAAERQVALNSLAQGTAAALRAKHGRAKGAGSPSTLITAQHVDAASKVRGPCRRPHWEPQLAVLYSWPQAPRVHSLLHAELCYLLGGVCSVNS